MEINQISFIQQIDICKHPLIWQPAVGGQTGVRSPSSNGEGASFQMPDSFLKDIFGGSVVDGKIETDFGYMQASHGLIRINA